MKSTSSQDNFDAHLRSVSSIKNFRFSSVSSEMVSFG